MNIWDSETASRAVRWLPRLIGPAILVFILARVDAKQAMAIVQRADPTMLAAAMALLPIILAVRSHRWYLLLRDQSIVLGLLETLCVYAVGGCLGIVTPGRLGELLRVAYIRRQASGVGAAFASVIIDRLLDVAVLMVVGIAALYPLLRFESLVLRALVVVGALAAILGVILSIARPWLFTQVRNLAQAARARRLGERIAAEGRDFMTALGRLRPRTWAIAAFESLAGWILSWWGIYLLAAAVDLAIPFRAIAGASALAAMLTMLPISVLGLGTRDATLIMFLGSAGVSEAEALALSALTLVYLLSYGLMCSLALLTPFGKLGRRYRAIATIQPSKTDHTQSVRGP